MTTDLSQLTTAAGKWDDMAAEIKKVEDRYKESVQSITLGPSWQGQSAFSAHTNFAATRYEYTAAQAEAKAIASLLRDAHTDLVRLKRNLENKVAAAVKAGMRVSEAGVVTFDYDKLTEGERAALRHDPDYAESVRKAVGSWSDAIDDCVRAVDDADQGVKIALDAVTVDGVTGDKNDETFGVGFNAKPLDDIEEYEAAHTQEIATRINNGDKVSAADIAEFQRSVRDNSHDKAFSQTLLNGLGPEGLMKVNTKLNDRAFDSDTKHKSQYLDIQRGLANTIATATKVPGSVKDAPPGSPAFKKWVESGDGKFYREWTDKLDEAGTKNFGSGTQPLYGYQSLVSLMQNADQPFDDQFLYDMGEDLIALDKKSPQYFEQLGAFKDGIETDPLDGLLGVMSRNPDAATAFFDPDGNGSDADHVDNNHLAYLAGHGDGTREWPKLRVSGIAQGVYDDPTSHYGLGLALEAAATGHQPLGPGQDPWPEATHTAAQARVMNGTIEAFAPINNDEVSEGTEATVPPLLRRSVANALAEYASDTHEIIGTMDGRYIHPEENGYFMTGDNARLAASQDSVVQVLRGLSEDPEAYGTLHKAEARHFNNLLDEVPEGSTGFENDGRWGKAGAVLGAYTAIREDVINDARMDAYSEADWKAKVAYHVVGGAITPLTLPLGGGNSLAVGDALQRGVDTWAWEWSNSMKAEADVQANGDIAEEYLSATVQASDTVDGWAAARSDTEALKTDDLKNNIYNGLDRGSNLAHKYVTDTTN
ncbi:MULTISPECIES: DUF6571 family protein [Streptomyces]|uniref:DUF6571 family protein n=1 Tax=Streptomyces flavovirens TaxID=52258 RepID=A0ABV8N1K8_9ACTN|nr:DUF6571 family protein [Streptomyces sp. MBT51]